MDKLIPTINKMQDLVNSLEESPIDLPQLVVVGSQSTGKSSVPEHIVGRDFLPRGNDIVTRRPLVLQLFNLSASNGDDDIIEWAEFSHLPDQTFLDFDQVRQEIERETERVAGKNKGVVREPIGLRIYSPKVLNLTLVDLPGITKVPVGDQPTDIEKRIKRIIMEYVSNPNSIILAVSAANVDIANSEALKIAREVDPEGNRTIGVLTKVDLMDEGTDAMEVLNGRICPLKLGYIPVVNRSQKDIRDQKKIAAALKAEAEFFKAHPSYRTIANRCGTPYLAFTLNRILVQHIRFILPGLKRKIEEMRADCQQKYLSFGGVLGDTGANKLPTLLHLLNQYSTQFVDSLDGNSGEISTYELRGGASIQLIFNDGFQKSLYSLDPCRGLTVQDIRTAIRNSSGVRAPLFVSERSFENLAKKAIQRLYDPSFQCVQLVAHELERMIEKCFNTELSRYPALKQKIFESVQKMIAERMEPTNQMVRNLVDIEAAFINTSHPQFMAIKSVEQYLEKKKQDLRSKNLPGSQDLRGKAPQLSGGASFQESEPSPQEPQSSNRSLFSFLWGRGEQGMSGAQQSQGSLADVIPPTNMIRSPLSEQEEMEIEFIRSLLTSYFEIVKRNIGDTVPKSIIHFMVNFVKQNMLNRLIADLYKEEKLDELLTEDKEVAVQRISCKAKLDVLTRAAEILNQISDTDLI